MANGKPHFSIEGSKHDINISSGSAAPNSVPSKDATKIASPSSNDARNIVRRKLTGYVGFANLPNQWHRKSVRKGFNFNVMVVGMSIDKNSEALQI